MELKQRKYINNLPKYVNGKETFLVERMNLGEIKGLDFNPQMDLSIEDPGLAPLKRNQLNPNASNNSGANIGPWFALGAWAGEGITNGLNKVFTSTDDMRMNAGTSVGQGTGFQYEKANNIDVGAEMKNYKRDTAATFLSNPFEGLTKLFGGNHYRKQLEKAQRQQVAQNTFNYSSAQSGYLNDEYTRNHYNTDNGVLYAATGLDTGYSGPALVSKDETQVDNLYSGDINKIKMKTFTKGKRHVDNQKTTVKPETFIAGKLPDVETGLEIQDEAKPLAWMFNNTDDKTVKQYAVNEMRKLANKQKIMNTVPMYKKGKMPRCAFGYNDALGLFGGLTALGNHTKAALDKVYKPNTFVANPYEQLIMNELNNIKTSPYPILNLMYAADRMNRYANNRSGGLSGALKYIGNVAQSLGSQANIGNAMYNWMLGEQQNRLKTAELKNSISSATTARKQQSKQYDMDRWLAGQNAKNQALRGSTADILAQTQQWAANKMKLDQFNDMYYLYATDPKRFKG